MVRRHYAPVKTWLWIHLIAQAAATTAAVLYLGRVREILHTVHPDFVLPWTTHYAIELRWALWLLPVAFGIIAWRLSLRPSVDSKTVGFVTAGAALVTLCVVSLAVLATWIQVGCPQPVG